MCGLFGGISGRGAPDINIIKTLGILNQERGEDSCGISFGHTLLKGAGVEAKWTKFIQKNKIEFKPSDHVVIGHVRKKTQGIASERNAHPFKIPIINKEGKDYCIIGAHNGNITNWRELCTKAGLTPADYDVDSHAAYALIGRSFRKGDYSFFEEYVGKAALIWTFSDEDAIYVFHGESMENNSTYKDTISEERPLHYWTDPKKNVTYFSSEAGPLESIATDNADIHPVPCNQILKFTSAGIEVIAEIARATKSYQVYWESVNHNNTPYNNRNRNLTTRNVDNGDFDKKVNSVSTPFRMNPITTDKNSGLIILHTDLITTRGLKPKYVSLVDVYLLEDKFENGQSENQVVFVKSRYYKNGHLADGIMYLTKEGKLTNKKFNKKDLTVSVNENGVNVPYSKYYFSDGLLFASEADYTKYLKIVKKGLKNEEVRVLPSAKPRIAHADFIRRVAKEGVKFLAPVSTHDVTTSSIILPKGIKESKEIWNEKIPFTSTQFIISDGKLRAIIYPERKEIIAHKDSVVFSSGSQTPTNSGSSTRKPTDIADLFEDVPSRGTFGSKELAAIPWNSLMFNYATGTAYAYDAANNIVKAVLAFWAISKQEYNDARMTYYYPIQWTLIDATLTLPEFTEVIEGISKNKAAYEGARKKFFDDIEWYKDLEPFTLDTARDMSLIKEFKGTSIIKAIEIGEESYTEPVEEKGLTTLIGRNFIDLCQIAGKPANKSASEEVDKDYFIDWANCLLWDVSRDGDGNIMGLFKAFKFSLKLDRAQQLPLMLVKVKLEEGETAFLEKEEFVSYLNTTYSEKDKDDYKEAFVDALEKRGFTLLNVNDYDSFVDEIATIREENRWSTATPKPPINGNDNLDKNDYLSKKIRDDDMLDATNLKYQLSKIISDIRITTEGQMKAINEFLKFHEGLSLMEAGLTDYMNLFGVLKSKLDLFSRDKEKVKVKSLSDKNAVLDALTQDDSGVAKLAAGYLKTPHANIHDVLTGAGTIYRKKFDPKTNENLYVIVGQWKPVTKDGNIELEYDIREEVKHSTHLDELFGLTLALLIMREQIVIEILKYRAIVCKNGNQKTVVTSSLV